VEKLNVVVGGYNLLINSGMNDDDDGDGVPDEWTGSSTITNGSHTLDATYKVVGASSFHVGVAAGNNDGDKYDLYQDVTLADVPLAIGDDFVLSVYVLAVGLSDLRAQVFVRWFDGVPSAIRDDSLGWITSDQGWTRDTLTNTVPATAVTARIVFRVQLSADNGTGHVYFDAVKLERGDVPTAWTTGMIGNVTIDGNRVQVQDANAKVWLGKRGSALGMWGEDAAGNLEVGWYASGANAGAIVGGAGAVKLDADGISALVSTAYFDERSYQFRMATGTVVSRLAAYYNTEGNVNAAELLVKSVASWDSAARIRVESPAGEDAQVILSAYHAAGSYADLVCDVSIGNVASVFCVIDGTIRLNVTAAGVAVTGGLSVTGAITGPTIITASGDIQGDEIKTDGANTDGTARWQLGHSLPGAASLTHLVEIWINGAKWVMPAAQG